MSLRCRLGIVWLAFGLVGCTTYTPPADLGVGQVAVLHGSTMRERGFFHVRVRAEPAHIDGKRIFNNGFTADQALALAPGRHVIDVSVFRYGFPVTSGSSGVAVTLLAGRDYTIHATVPAPHVNADGQTADWANESDVWIATGDQAVTEKVPVYLQMPPPPPIIIFVPVK